MHAHRSVEPDAVDDVVRRERGAGHVERIAAHREVKRGHARRQRRERRGLAVAVDREDGARTVADEQRPVRRKRETARDAEVGRERLGAPVVRHPIYGALEPARDVETAIPVERHRRRVDDRR